MIVVGMVLRVAGLLVDCMSSRGRGVSGEDKSFNVELNE